jgi:glycosyltransferase involved in cell wall biosynthesis
MLSIAVVTQQYGQVISGIGLHAQNLVTSLVQAGHRVTLVAPEQQRPSDSLPLQFVGVAPPLFSNTQARWFSLAWNFSRALKRLEQCNVFDLIHFTDARESLFSQPYGKTVGNVNDTYAAKMRSLSYYRNHYEDWMLRWMYYRFVKSFEAYALPRIDGIIANSHHTAKTVVNQYHIPENHVHICYKSIKLDQHTKGFHPQRNPSQAPRVLFVGGNMQRKGLPTLIRAAPYVLRELPDTEFWVVGQDSVEMRMKELCHLKDVDTAFRFLGWRRHTELLDLYRGMDVFVMPSLEEAFGVVFLEAMASGVPVIGTRVGGVSELIQHEVNGLLVDPEDPEGLSRAIIRVLEDSSLESQITEAGLQTVKRFGVDDMMTCTYQVYKAILNASYL